MPLLPLLVLRHKIWSPCQAEASLQPWDLLPLAIRSPRYLEHSHLSEGQGLALCQALLRISEPLF